AAQERVASAARRRWGRWGRDRSSLEVGGSRALRAARRGAEHLVSTATSASRPSGGQGWGGVEERREVVGAHVAALEVGDRGGVGDAVAEEAGSALGPERDRDHGWERLVAGELPRAGDERADVGCDDP